MKKHNNEKKITVIYIVGTGRSGSTLLDRTLGQLPGVVSVGELDYISEIRLDEQLCGCGQSFAECELWSRVEYDGDVGVNNFPMKQIDGLRQKVERNVHIPKMFFKGDSAFYHNLADYEDCLRKIYTAISQASGCGIIVDSSKDLRRLFILNRMEQINLVVIHLVRDPRAVAYSWTKTYLRPELINETAYMHQFNPIQTSWRWLYKNTLINLTKGMFSKYIRIFYDEFVTHPKAILASFLPLIGMEPEDLVFIEGNCLHLQKQTHTVSGNPMRFSEGTIKFRYDDAWKRKMPPIQKLAVTIISLPLEVIYFFSRLLRPKQTV